MGRVAEAVLRCMGVWTIPSVGILLVGSFILIHLSWKQYFIYDLEHSVVSFQRQLHKSSLAKDAFLTSITAQGITSD
jgi:hypothetical protein